MIYGQTTWEKHMYNPWSFNIVPANGLALFVCVSTCAFVLKMCLYITETVGGNVSFNTSLDILTETLLWYSIMNHDTTTPFRPHSLATYETMTKTSAIYEPSTPQTKIATWPETVTHTN